MDALIFILIILTIVSVTSTDRVKWVPNTSFNLPKNFKDGKLPCSKKDVVFPKSVAGSIDLQSVLDVGSLILPETGEIVLQDVVIELGGIAEENCTKGNSYYLDNAVSSWTRAGVWTASRFNEATPDSERLPCYNDIAEFPTNGKYTVQLPDQEQELEGVLINDHLYLNSHDVMSTIQKQTDEMQQYFQLNSVSDTGLVIKHTDCHMRIGCPCQQKPVTIDCSAKFCPKPSCVAPVKAEGFCCSFCGGHIMFDIDEGFDILTFQELVEKTVVGYGSSLAYHIGVILKDTDYKLQLVIVEKGEYDGSSSVAVNSVNYYIEKEWYKGEKLFLVSGSPLSKQGLGWKICISMFFGVVFVMGLIYLYYYKVPQVRAPAVGGGVSRVFSRFQNRSDSVVSLTRRDSSISSVLPSGTAFRNPLYDSKRGRVQVTEQSVDED